MTPAKPSWRKPAGIFLILALIAFWAWLVATCADRLPATWLRLPFFIVAGLVWIMPLKPLLRWMETGNLSLFAPSIRRRRLERRRERR